MQFIDLAVQYQCLKERINNRIQGVLKHGQYIMGPEVEELEEKLANYVGVKHAITCANGTDALTLSLMAMGIEEGDVVFVPTFTFFASAEAVAFSNAKPVFVDSNPDTFNICPKDLEKKINAVKDEGRYRPKAIMAVDLFGLPSDYSEIQRIAKVHSLQIIEDAAQGFGGSIKGGVFDNDRSGSFGDIATTSFFPAKPLGCYGDGGAIFTNDDNYAELIKSYRIHGKGSDKYDNVRIGMNSRLDTLQAAILLEKLSVFPQELLSRNQVAYRYSKALSVRFNTPVVPDGYVSSWAQYTLVAENSKDRDSIIQHLKASEVPSMIYYGTCLHQQTAFSYLEYKEGDFPVAERLAKTVFSLPMHPYMNERDQSKIIATLLGW